MRARTLPMSPGTAPPPRAAASFSGDTRVTASAGTLPPGMFFARRSAFLTLACLLIGSVGAFLLALRAGSLDAGWGDVFAVLGGQVELLSASLGGALPFIKQGKMKAKVV